MLVTINQLKKFRLRGPRTSSACSCWCNYHVRKEMGIPSTVPPQAVCQVSGISRKAAEGSTVTEGQFIFERR